MTEYDKIIGRNIRNQRKYRNISSTELAQMLDISLSSIGHIERGKRSISIANLIKLTEIFNMGIEHFFYGTKAKIVISEEKTKDPIQEKKNTLSALLFDMDINELEFIISVVRDLKILTKNDKTTEYEKDDSIGR